MSVGGVHSDNNVFSGGMAVSIGFDSRAWKEDGINAAIKSLGDRSGDDPESISEDLRAALRERDLGLETDLLMHIAEGLADVHSLD